MTDNTDLYDASATTSFKKDNQVTFEAVSSHGRHKHTGTILGFYKSTALRGAGEYASILCEDHKTRRSRVSQLKAA